jgi:hypothetical protein
MQVQVPGFLPTAPVFVPSAYGLHFLNYYPHEPTIEIKVPLGPTLPLGDAANGLCGGMAFTVRDFYEAKQQIPPDQNPPPAGSPLYQFIVQRLLESFNLPFGIGRYLELMQPAFPDVGPGFGLPGRATVMVRDEWPHIKSDLDNGILVPLGLIKVKSSNPSDLGKNHQVLAYGYDLDGTDLTIWLYDPNYPDKDDTNLRLSIASIQVPVPVVHAPEEPGEDVICFFRTPYSPKQPPAL